MCLLLSGLFVFCSLFIDIAVGFFKTGSLECSILQQYQPVDWHISSEAMPIALQHSETALRIHLWPMIDIAWFAISRFIQRASKHRWIFQIFFLQFVQVCRIFAVHIGISAECLAYRVHVLPALEHIFGARHSHEISYQSYQKYY